MSMCMPGSNKAFGWINPPILYILQFSIMWNMGFSIAESITRAVASVPKVAVGVLLGIMVFGIFMVGFDQGQLFALASGEAAYEDKWMHEFYHDMRHAAGFPCH